MKKISILLMALVLAFSMCFVGCSKDDSKSDESKGNETEQTDENSDESENDNETQGKIENKVQLLDLIKKSLSYDSYYYEYENTFGDTVMKGKYYQKGDNIKSETGSSVSISTNEYIINYDTETKTGMKMTSDGDMDFDDMEDADADADSEINLEDSEFEEFQLIGDETVNGFDCVVFTYNEEGSTIKMWVSKKYGIGVKYEITLEENCYSMEIKNIEVNKVSDKEFEVPEDIEIIEY